jgi:hypothetical protein
MCMIAGAGTSTPISRSLKLYIRADGTTVTVVAITGKKVVRHQAPFQPIVERQRVRLLQSVQELIADQFHRVSDAAVICVIQDK